MQIILAVAFFLATIFTSWVPGQSQPSIVAAPTLIVPTPTTVVASPIPGGPTATPRSRPLIGIVAGHWQNDSGAVCPDGLKEVEVNLNIAGLVQKLLTEKGFDTELLAEFDPRLNGYVADVLISIHNDSCDYINDQATGFKVASAKASTNAERAANLVACLRSRYAMITGLSLHSTSVTPDMASYHAFDEIDPITPAAIIETGFLNLDRQFLTQQPERAAQGVVAGILCFINHEEIFPATPVSTP